MDESLAKKAEKIENILMNLDVGEEFEFVKEKRLFNYYNNHLYDYLDGMKKNLTFKFRSLDKDRFWDLEMILNEKLQSVDGFELVCVHISLIDLANDEKFGKNEEENILVIFDPELIEVE